MKDIRIAAVNSHSQVGKTLRNIEGMVQWVRAAKRKGASVVCFPEMNITGYSTRQEIEDVAKPIPSSVTASLSEMARTEQITILVGMAEKDDKGRIFATHLVITPDGLSGAYRKLHMAPPEQSVFQSGDEVPLFEVDGIRFGIQLCYDAHFPELSTLMALKGADLIFIPHASPRGTPEQKYRSWMRHLPARAYDNSVFIIACNQVGKNGNGLSFPGVAVALDPAGNVLEKRLSEGEDMLLADIRADALKRVRDHKMRFFLPNRRPELLKTLFSESATRPYGVIY
ncbi:MAG: nitrilase [Deltaproteobacteria bacterium]|nr:MAG: nitrilase [Deltaproteobacteria bacterium]